MSKDQFLFKALTNENTAIIKNDMSTKLKVNKEITVDLSQPRHRIEASIKVDYAQVKMYIMLREGSALQKHSCSIK